MDAEKVLVEEKWRQSKPGDTILSSIADIPFVVTEVVDGHVWGNFSESFIPGECCRICCMMRRRDRQNRPCRGSQKISLREKEVRDE